MHTSRPERILNKPTAWVVLLLALALAGCIPTATPAPQAGSFQVIVAADGKQARVEVPAGTNTQAALEKAGVKLNPLDRVDPPSYTLLTEGATVKVTRVREAFTMQEKVIPFERQTVRNESLPEGQTLLVQAGVNGLQQLTYRQVFENDQEVSNSVFKTDTVTEPLPEIIMVGVQKPFSPVAIPGKLAYLAGGNAWLMEKTTGDRRPLVTTGDLDGYIFSLSPDGNWLLFTRKEKTGEGAADQTGIINTLWVISLTEDGARPFSLKVNNVKWFADWLPGRARTLLYSTVEPRTTEPGWQANNDLRLLTFSENGTVGKSEEILGDNAGGLYGWWGTIYAISPDGALLAYARPDGIGLVDLSKKELTPLADILPFQTGSNWAWVTGLGWSPDHRVLYYVAHAGKPGLENQETSPLFDLAAIPLFDQGDKEKKTVVGGPPIHVVPLAGMFAYPVPAPAMADGSFQVAFLQAIFPEQSDTKRYRLVIMDRDGSNHTVLFPPQDFQGLNAQRVYWSPQPFQNGSPWLAVIYQKNLWLVDSKSGQAQQITGDGLLDGIDWK